MTKRVGYIYEQMADWYNIVEAEAVSTKRKQKNFGVRKHIASRWENLCEIQQNILSRNMKTSEYMHDRRISGQDKMRDIAKLHFHPSHIQHQLLTIVAERRTDKAFIRHTYASRKGYGQIKAAQQIEKFLRKHRHEEIWYAQGDICKYYDHVQHGMLRADLEHLFKDKEFIDAFIEPFERFNPKGIKIPLGIRPSQIAGNIRLMTFDRFATSEVKCDGYLRYLDDFVFFGATKGEVNAKMKRLKKFLEKEGFEIHVPKIHRVSEGLDMLGFVYYNNRNDMFWRKSNKKKWLKRRSKVTNPKRLRELDDAAWGMLKWGNSHCKRMFEMKTGIKRTHNKTRKDMGVKITNTNFQRSERLDQNGVPFIDAPKATMGMVINKPLEVRRVVKDVKTSHGENRYAVEIFFMGDTWKIIINSCNIKTFLNDMERQHITRIKTAFIDTGGKHYDVDMNRTEILEVNNRAIEAELDSAGVETGRIVYSDTKEIVNLN